MELAELTTLFTADALQLLASLPAYESKADVLKLVADLRRA
jgi:hypothetical protein